MSQPGGGEVPAEESTPSKASIEEEKRGVEGDYRGNPASWCSQVVRVILSSQVPHLDTAISSSCRQEFSTRGETVKVTERNWAGVDASESSGHLEKIFNACLPCFPKLPRFSVLSSPPQQEPKSIT